MPVRQSNALASTITQPSRVTQPNELSHSNERTR